MLTTGYLLSSIVMQWVQGEAPLDLTAYLAQYLMLLPPTIVFVSSIALLFQAIPRRAGTTDLVSSIPRLQARYLFWKLGVTLLLGFGFTLVAILKLSTVAPGAALDFAGFFGTAGTGVRLFYLALAVALLLLAQLAYRARTR